MAKRRKRFSHVLSKVTFDGQVLEVRGRMRLVSVLLVGMTALMGGFSLFGEDLPIFVRLMMGFGALITGYGVIDVLFGESFVRFSPSAQRLQLRRGNPFSKVSFNGSARRAQKIHVSRIRAGVGPAQVPLYAVVFAVTLEDAFVTFPLETASYPDAAADQKIAEWEAKLGLGPEPEHPPLHAAPRPTGRVEVPTPGR